MAYDFYVRTKQDLIDAVQEYGIIPYFGSSIPGFSLEEHCHPLMLFNDTEDNSWFWKGPVIQETGCAYGKFFGKKAAYVRKDLFLDLANYRRDGYDYDARYEDGLARFQDKQLYDLISENAPVLSKVLRKTGGYAYSGRWQKNRRHQGFRYLRHTAPGTVLCDHQRLCFHERQIRTSARLGCCGILHAGEDHGNLFHRECV